MGPANTVTCTIPAGESLSDGASCGTNTGPVMLIAPPDWSPNVPISIQVSIDGGQTYFDMCRTDGSEAIAYINPGAGIGLESDLHWASNIKLRSGSFLNPVPQDSDRTFTIVLA